MCIIFEKNLSKTRNKINSTLTKIKKPTNYLPLFIFIQSLCKNIWKRSIFIFTNRFLISIIEYTFYHHPIINQTISLISLKKKKKRKNTRTIISLHPRTTLGKKLPGNSFFLPPSTIRTFLSRCAIRLQSNKSTNKTPYQHGSFHDSIMHHHLHH